MSMDRDKEDRFEFEDDEEESRSIFSATWFRVVLAFVGLGVVAVVAMPYLLGGGAQPEKSAVTASPPLLDTKPATGIAPSPGDSPGPLVTVTPPPKEGPSSLAEKAKAAPPTAEPSGPDAVSPEPVKPRVASPEPAKPKAASTEAAKPAQPRKDAPKVATARSTATKPAAVKATAGTRKPYWVQVGTFKDPEAARRLAARLREQKMPVTSRPVAADAGDRLSRVRVGPFPDKAAATSALRELEAQGFKPFIARG